MTDIEASTPFGEEKTLNYKVSSESQLIHDRNRLNGRALIAGLEMELTPGGVTEDGQLLANYASLHTEYMQLPFELMYFEGKRLRNAPENLYTMTAFYETCLSRGAKMDLVMKHLQV